MNLSNNIPVEGSVVKPSSVCKTKTGKNRMATLYGLKMDFGLDSPVNDLRACPAVLAFFVCD